MPYVKGGMDYDYLVALIGVADSGSNTTLTDSSKDVANNMFQNARIHIFKINSTGVEYVRYISSNTSNTFTFDPLPTGVEVAEGDEYCIKA